MTEWIDIKDEKPEVDVLVNVCGGEIEAVSSGFYNPGYGIDGFEVVCDVELELRAVTHWAKLPTAFGGDNA